MLCAALAIAIVAPLASLLFRWALTPTYCLCTVNSTLWAPRDMVWGVSLSSTAVPSLAAGSHDGHVYVLKRNASIGVHTNEVWSVVRARH